MKTVIIIYFAAVLISLSVISCEKDNTEDKISLTPPIFNPKLEYGTVTDQDGNTYKTIKIGLQTWMAENLRTTRYNDGTNIERVDQYDKWRYYTKPGYCWYYNDTTNRSVYGALYNGYAVNTGKLAPIGWHVPTDEEWLTMLNDAGGEFYAAPCLREVGHEHWLYKYSFTLQSDNKSGFTALPAGYREPYEFLSMGYLAYWWTSSRFETFEFNYVVSIDGNSIIANRNHERLDLGLSVRCVKDR